MNIQYIKKLYIFEPRKCKAGGSLARIFLTLKAKEDYDYV